MIDVIGTWLPQIIGYANLIASGQLAKEWTSRKYTTSIVSYDELIEQVFDDLDSESIIKLLPGRGDINNVVVEAASLFVSSLLELDRYVEKNNLSDQYSIIVSSGNWNDVVMNAQNLLKIETSDQLS